LVDAKVSRERVVAIGSHGQTIRHRPNANPRFTMQIGDPNIITERTGVTTVADFRRRDVAAGGQGAPLVPAFHDWLFRSASVDRAVVNIGGIANVTILDSTRSTTVLGFDTGPGNGLMDSWVAKHHDRRFDEGGTWASTGRVNQALLERLLGDPYFEAPPPKSTGREDFNLEWLERRAGAILSNVAASDVQATLCALTAQSIADSITDVAPSTTELFVCGGGTHNLTLMSALRERCEARSVAPTHTLGLDPDWVEAVAFAWLAKQTLSRAPGNMASVTGAHGPRVLGGIYFI
nr:anhydro-N-acetylmuramic acid kinase [Gammaproteobacteria bacterium]